MEGPGGGNEQAGEKCKHGETDKAGHTHTLWFGWDKSMGQTDWKPDMDDQDNDWAQKINNLPNIKHDFT